MAHANLFDSLARTYHEQMPSRIRRYLHERGITDTLIWINRLGWNAERITIPVRDRMGRFRFFRLAKDPEDTTDSPKMLTPPGEGVELYGWELINSKTQGLVICEGEYDRLVLERFGFPAVTSTGGASVFKQEWAEVIARIPQVWVCFDRDEPGQRGANRVARMIFHARIVELPEEVGEGGDVTDYLVRLRNTRADFIQLLKAAKKAEKPPRSVGMRPKPHASTHASTGDLAELKARVRIEDVIGRYVPLSSKGRYHKGRCPFHEDRTPSFVVYRETQRFHCFGCGAKGDVVDFLMRREEICFTEALERLRAHAPSP